MPDNPELVSLLWPTGGPSAAKRNWQSNSIADLGLEALINALNFDGKHADSIKNILLALCDQPGVIRYRQDIIEDFLRCPDLIQHFESLLPKLSDLAYYSKISEIPALPFQKTLARMGELELYIQVVEKLASFFHDSKGALTSTGFANLHRLLQQRMQDPIFKQMQTALPELTAKFREIKSITVGVNLDHNLLPIGATIVSINSTLFQGSSFMKKLFGQRDEFHGLSQLHSVPMRSVATSDGRLVETQLRTDPMLVPLFKDLDVLIADAFRPIMTALKGFLKVSAEFLAVLEPEIVFYLGAIRLIRQLQASGLPMCRADIRASEERLCVIRDCYNLHLALRNLYRDSNAKLSGRVVGNDVNFDADGRIFIITGPNQGGKTTYIQALALAQVVFQAGLYVPGSSATISPVDGIYTHFPVEEKPNAEMGRFGEEAQRLNDIFSQVTRYSLVLLNETLSSTASGESLYLARDIIRSLRLLGARVAYTTHMHELAASADELNSTTQGDSTILSLVAVAQIDSSPDANGDIKRTYKIIPSPPMGRSYANELAARYGISFDKIVNTLKAREVI